MTVAIIYFFILFFVFYGKNTYIFFHTIKCFKFISKDKMIGSKFTLKINGKKVENPKVSFLGVLYFYVIIPPDMPIKFVDDFLNSQFLPVNDMLMTLDLTGAVRANRREFITDTDDNNYTDNKIYKYVVKFHPIFWYNRPRKFLILLITFFASWFFMHKFHIFEYITIDNIKLIGSYIQDFLTIK